MKGGLRDPQRIKALVIGPSTGEAKVAPKPTHNSRPHRRRRKLRLEELYAMYLTKKPFNQLTAVDKAMAREELARKVLKHYFSSSWSTGYLQLLKELEDFFDKFPKAGKDKVTFARFARSLSVQELKTVFTADPDTLFAAVLWLKRHEGRARRGGAFAEFYQRVLQAVSELQSDKWSRKLVKAVFKLLDEFRPSKDEGEEGRHNITDGRKEINFYDYFAVFLMKRCKVSAGPAFTAAVLTTRHVVAEYFFDPDLNYRSRLNKIREHFKPLFEEYPQAEALLDDYFVRSVVKSMTWRDLIRFTGCDIKKLERFLEKNRHKLSPVFENKLLGATLDHVFVSEKEMREWWREHNRALSNITALACNLQ